MRNLEIKKLEKINGGGAGECALALTGLALSFASLFVSPATGGASLLVSQGAIAASSASVGLSCSGDTPVQK